MYTRLFARRALELVESHVEPEDGIYVREKLPSRFGKSSQDVWDQFHQAEYTELCDDAELLPFVVYLRGCTGLAIPAKWRPLIPTHL